MRNRLEDLGRIAVLIKNVLDHELFSREESLKLGRPKDVHEWFASKTSDQKEEIIRSWAYGLENIAFALYDILSIAEGTDYLNEGPND